MGWRGNLESLHLFSGAAHPSPQPAVRQRVEAPQTLPRAAKPAIRAARSEAVAQSVEQRTFNSIPAWGSPSGFWPETAVAFRLTIVAGSTSETVENANKAWERVSVTPAQAGGAFRGSAPQTNIAVRTRTAARQMTIRHWSGGEEASDEGLERRQDSSGNRGVPRRGGAECGAVSEPEQSAPHACQAELALTAVINAWAESTRSDQVQHFGNRPRGGAWAVMRRAVGS